MKGLYHCQFLPIPFRLFRDLFDRERQGIGCVLVYRLDGKADELGLEEYFNKGGITIIEWADMIEDYLPEERLDIKFKSYGEEENTRMIVITPHGQKYEDICEAIL